MGLAFLGVFSLALAYLILNDVFRVHDYPQIPSSDLAYAYHLSKFYEYIDVFNLVAGGVTIGPHMAFHHITTPVMTSAAQGSQGRPPAFRHIALHVRYTQ